MSLDGFIATNDDDLSWLSVVEKEGEDYGYAAFNESVDTYIVGRRTYDKVLEMTAGVFPAAQQHKCYVLTRKTRTNENGVHFYNEDIEELVNHLKSEKGKNIYCDGGAQVVKLLMDKNLIDEYILSVIPIMLGDGKRLFIGGTPRVGLKKMPVKEYSTGLVQLHYVKVNT